MNTMTLSSKFQIGIPKKIREEMHLKAGQKFTFITKGNILHLVPQQNIADFKGILSGTDTQNIRDRKDRV
ncbi:MAG: AbrB/MazE/SpoVT family DNA-binding domain-containing protein [Gammaproteobacteria bacterium]